MIHWKYPFNSDVPVGCWDAIFSSPADLKPNAVILVGKILRRMSDITKIQAALDVPRANRIHPVSVSGKQQKQK